MKNLLFLLVVTFVFSASSIFADTLYLAGGEVAEGKIVQETEDAYIFQQGASWKQIGKTDVVVAHSNNENNNIRKQKIDLDLILKFGRDLSSKATISDSDNLNGLYDTSGKYYAGLEFDIKAFSNVYFGLGFNFSNDGYITDTSVYYRDIPYYLLVKIKHNVGKQNNLYASVNFGMHSLILKGRTVGNSYGSDSVSGNTVYYGLNIGYELKNFIIELGFTSCGAKMHSNTWNLAGHYDNYNYTLINQNIVLNIGYKIL
jgi:hypothetical protein